MDRPAPEAEAGPGPERRSSHTASARAEGMTEAMRGELLAVVGMAAETNRLAEALRVPPDTAHEG